MAQNTPLEINRADAPVTAPHGGGAQIDQRGLQISAAELAHKLGWVPSVSSSHYFEERCQLLSVALNPVIDKARGPLPQRAVSDDLRWLHDNGHLVVRELQSTCQALTPLETIPHVQSGAGPVVPRVSGLASGFLTAASYQFSEEALAAYLESFQKTTVLNVAELYALVPALELVILEQIAERGAKVLSPTRQVDEQSLGIGVLITSLREITQADWKELIESFIVFDRVLREDPAGAYPRMDYNSRHLYRNKVVNIASHSDSSEMEVASQVLALAQAAHSVPSDDPRLAQRRSHVGYYLVAEGASELHAKVGYRPPLGQRIQLFLRAHPEDFYLPSIQILTFALITLVVLLLTSTYSSLSLVLLSLLVLLLPCSQSAVQLINYLTTSVLPPQILPKLDFSKAVPEDCLTLVAVPTLILNEKQVTRLIDNLEIRYLGNHDPNIHFALLTDLPDSVSSPDEEAPLVELCARKIAELNQRYAERGQGLFLLLHRHRVYNPRERVWMGWERKRGKLLDLNKLLQHAYDSFPVKIGDMSVLDRVRFVITLDADTELPRGEAQRMVGALAHPLNQAIIDPEKNIVVQGYGILQPRVGVSVESSVQSRLAYIYSGATGFDIYTRAASDAYQDLFGEGIFTGKGIYEVSTLHQVLDRRFPRNALLSHDLIEGAYARAGLASDIEVIEDYPSHYSAYNRRKHRWLRGDWQIAGWLSPRVPDESGSRVPNPISMISQWKILDNLRRSLVEPATFLLLVMGWLVLPGSARNWTLATIVVLFLPAWCQFIIDLIHAAIDQNRETLREAFAGLLTANINIFLTLTFLAHQMLISVDATARALFRRFVTGERLLEWETAAEAELGAAKTTPLDVYLNWIPALSVLLGIAIWFVHRRALWSAAPILLLWACSKAISNYLNRPPSALRSVASEKDDKFLRASALRTWRYFAAFSTEEHHWLIPDNVQEEPPSVAARVSPTNVGMLLNARQVACEFGYLTVPEFASVTRETLNTITHLPKHRGHLFNWYETTTLAPLSPSFISSVDSGNLVASLWTLRQGALDLLRRPLFEPSLVDGVEDHVSSLQHLKSLPRKSLAAYTARAEDADWFDHLLALPEINIDSRASGKAENKLENDSKWLAAQLGQRIKVLRESVSRFTPWLLPEFASLRSEPSLKMLVESDKVPLNDLPAFVDELSHQLGSLNSAPESPSAKLLSLLPSAKQHLQQLISDLQNISSTAGELGDAMDFSFLLNRKRKLLSIGFDADNRKVNDACYDLLASEASIATFISIAKEDIPQDSWFNLGRDLTSEDKRPVLVSWTGTMFEYLMPALWMRSYPDTLLDRTRGVAVLIQRKYADSKHVPWGISESAYSQLSDAGHYHYQAFGIPKLALNRAERESLVISPYSTFLALNVDPGGSLQNLHRMSHDGWMGAYGFYEAADFSESRQHPANTKASRERYELVRCWMAHHQGMSLLAIANFLHTGIVQRWFHSDRRVQATELLLHEKPIPLTTAA